MKTVQVCSVLVNMKKVFARRIIGMDFSTREFYLHEGVTFDVAEGMLLLIENLHKTCGFDTDLEEMQFVALKEKFYRDINKETEMLRELLMTELTRRVVEQDEILNLEDEMDMLGIHTAGRREKFKAAQEDKNHPAWVAARQRAEAFLAELEKEKKDNM